MTDNAPTHGAGRPTPGGVFVGSSIATQPSVAQPLLSGAYGGDEPPVAPPAPPAGRAVWFLAIIGALTLLVGGGFMALQAFAADGGAETPEAAMDQLIDALNNEDAITLGELLEPGERRTMVEPMLDDVLPELIRLGIFSEDFDAADIGGIDLRLDDVTYRIDPIAGHSDLVHAYFTGGTASSSMTVDELPLGDAIRTRFGSTMEDASEPSEQIDGADGMPVTLVERNGRWYVSVWHTVAEMARIESGLDLPSLGAQPAPLGAQSPEAAVDAMIGSIVDLDIDGMIGRLDPEEMAALYRYSPLFLDEARAELQKVRADALDEGVSWDVRDIGYDVDADGDDAIVTIRSFTASVETPGISVRVDYSSQRVLVVLSGTVDEKPIDGRIEITPGRWSASGSLGTDRLDVTLTTDSDAGTIAVDGSLNGETFAGRLDLDSTSGCTSYSYDGFDAAETGCLEDYGFVGVSAGEVAALIESFESDYPGFPIAVHRTDGSWYVSPMGTLMHGVTEGLRSVDRESFEGFLDDMVLGSDGPAMLGALATGGFGIGGPDLGLTDPVIGFDPDLGFDSDLGFDGVDSSLDGFRAPPESQREFFVPVSEGGAAVFTESVAAAEEHVYVVDLAEGQSVGVTLYGFDRVDGGIGDPYLEVETPSGEWYAENDDNDGLNSGLQFTTDRSGSWRIVARDLNSFAGAYELTVEVVAPGDSPSIGESMSIGFDPDVPFGSLEDSVIVPGAASTGRSASYDGSLSLGTYDAYSIDLAAGERVLATATDRASSGLDLKLVVLGPDGDVVAENDDAPFDSGLSPFDSQLELVVDEGGLYTVEVRTFADVGAGDFTFAIATS